MSLSLRLIEGKFIDNAPPKKTHTHKKNTKTKTSIYMSIIRETMVSSVKRRGEERNLCTGDEVDETTSAKYLAGS